MLNKIIPLLSAFLDSGIFAYFMPLLFLGFIATVPCIIRKLIRG